MFCKQCRQEIADLEQRLTNTEDRVSMLRDAVKDAANQTQLVTGSIEMRLDAVLREFERMRKESLTFESVPAQPARVRIARKVDD